MNVSGQVNELKILENETMNFQTLLTNYNLILSLSLSLSWQGGTFINSRTLSEYLMNLFGKEMKERKIVLVDSWNSLDWVDRKRGKREGEYNLESKRSEWSTGCNKFGHLKFSLSLTLTLLFPPCSV